MRQFARLTTMPAASYYVAAGKRDEGITDLNRVVDVKPSIIPAYASKIFYLTARIYERLGSPAIRMQ